MVCAKCKKLFFIKRSFLGLFREEKEFLCNECYKKYPISLGFESIKFVDYEVAIISLFKKKYPIDFNWYYKEYNQIIEANVDRDGYNVIVLDSLLLNQDTMEVLNYYCHLFKSNLIVVCFYLKN